MTAFNMCATLERVIELLDGNGQFAPVDIRWGPLAGKPQEEETLYFTGFDPGSTETPAMQASPKQTQLGFTIEFIITVSRDGDDSVGKEPMLRVETLASTFAEIITSDPKLGGTVTDLRHCLFDGTVSASWIPYGDNRGQVQGWLAGFQGHLLCSTRIQW